MKKKLILLLVILLGLSWYTAISEAVGNPKKAEAHVARAQELEKQGIYVDAIAEYESALRYAPENVEISLQIAENYLRMGKSKKFIAQCKSIAENHPKDQKALDRLMSYYMEKQNEGAAVRYLKELQEKYPDNETAVGWLLRLKGSYEELHCRFEEMGSMYGGSLVVKKEGGYGITDVMGEILLEAKYEEVYPYSKDALALIRKDGTYIYVDRDGQTRLSADPVYTYLGMMSSDRTVAGKDGKYGYLDEKLEPVTEFVWDRLTQISNGIGAGQKNGSWVLVDKNGEAKTEVEYEDVIVDEHGFCSHQNRIFVKEQDSYYLINKKGEPVGDLAFEDARCFSEEGYAAVCQNGLWGFINEDGEWAIECQYEEAESFHYGFAAIRKDGLWGYIDEEGHVVIEPQFEEVTSFSQAG